MPLNTVNQKHVLNIQFNESLIESKLCEVVVED